MRGDLVKACALLSALTISSCSLLLDWNGYTGGGTAPQPDGSMGGNDAMIQDDVNDAAGDLAVGSQDAQDAQGPADATNDVADARDASGLQDADGSGLMCSSAICGGCCSPSRSNYCFFGSADQTCGVGGQMCKDCTAQGLVCDKTNGLCVAPPADGGAPQACVVAQCAMMSRCNNTFNFQACCSMFTMACGCHIAFDPSPTCL